MPRIATLILAAGASRRLGRPKQLLEIDGRTLLRRTAELALSAAAGPVLVVLGARAEEMRPELAGLKVETIENPDWAEGMSTSLRAGIRRLETEQPPVAAVLVLLVDQPRVNIQLLDRLIRLYEERKPPVVASRYNGLNGVPAVFDRSLWEELKNIEGDRGARRVIRRYEKDMAIVDFPPAAEDIDTPEDWGRLKGD